MISERPGTIGQNLNGHQNGEVKFDYAPLTVSLEDEMAKRVDVVGGKAASLAELSIIPGIKVPEAFVVTTSLSDTILAQNPEIEKRTKRLDESSVQWIKAKLINIIRD